LGVHSWSVGDVEIVRVEDLAFAVPTDLPVPEWMVPDFAPSAHEVGIAFTAIAIAADGQRIVVDPVLANDGPRNQADAAEHVEQLLASMADAGFPAESVDVVVDSHFDGVGWNTRPTASGWQPTFPNARYLYPKAELDAIDRGAFPGTEGLDVLRDAGVLEATPHDVQLTPHVALVDAPGHNVGHVAVRVKSNDELAGIPGHLVLSPFQVHDPGIDVGDSDLATATTSRRRLLDELAARDGLLLTTLVGGPGGGVVRREGDGFRLDVVG
jgi:hypothetical protein